jgi:hypothetical protein
MHTSSDAGSCVARALNTFQRSLDGLQPGIAACALYLCRPHVSSHPAELLTPFATSVLAAAAPPLYCCASCLQLGSWVPAVSCVLSVFDGVYCRMGASDCLMLGRSTFAEELGEASHILATATNRCDSLCGNGLSER